MKILIIGSGGREHAIGLKLNESRHQPTLLFAPGNAGTQELGTNVAIHDISELIEYVKNNTIDLTIVGPEQPLVDGIVDQFKSEGLAIIGPDKKGAQLEGSKDWAKKIMKKAGIPTADFETFETFDTAWDYIKKENCYPIVIKADGLAAGKGVTIAETESEAHDALINCFKTNQFGTAGHQVVIEQFLEGEEVSIFAFTDGKTLYPMIPAQDHKRVYDNDKGPNTGGMGAYAPAPIANSEIQKKVKETVFTPLINQLNKEKIHYVGIIYAGLMISKTNDIYVVEFNARFGDPETQVVLPQLKTDLVDIFLAMSQERLSEIDIQWNVTPTVCTVMVAEGYPGKYEKNKQISIETLSDHSHIVFAGTYKDENNNYQSNGGRVLGVVSQGETLEKSIKNVYSDIEKIKFEGAYYRKDIAQKALKGQNAC